MVGRLVAHVRTLVAVRHPVGAALPAEVRELLATTAAVRPARAPRVEQRLDDAEGPRTGFLQAGTSDSGRDWFVVALDPEPRVPAPETADAIAARHREPSDRSRFSILDSQGRTRSRVKPVPVRPSRSVAGRSAHSPSKPHVGQCCQRSE
jgi:hypothetical protein